MNATTFQIIKTKKANNGFGDRACAVHYPAHYAVIVNGATVATIYGASQKYYDVPQWELRVEPSAVQADQPNCVNWSSKKFLVDYAMRRWGAQ